MLASLYSILFKKYKYMSAKKDCPVLIKLNYHNNKTLSESSFKLLHNCYLLLLC